VQFPLAKATLVAFFVAATASMANALSAGFRYNGANFGELP